MYVEGRRNWNWKMPPVCFFRTLFGSPQKELDIFNMIILSLDILKVTSKMFIRRPCMFLYVAIVLYGLQSSFSKTFLLFPFNPHNFILKLRLIFLFSKQEQSCWVAKSCPTICDPMDSSTPGFPVLHYLLEFVQIHVHWVGDAIQPSHPLSPPFPPALNLSQQQVFSSESALCIRWPKYWSFSFSISPYNEYLGLVSFRIDWFDLLAVQEILKSLLQHHNLKVSILWDTAFFMVQYWVDSPVLLSYLTFLGIKQDNFHKVPGTKYGLNKYFFLPFFTFPSLPDK